MQTNEALNQAIANIAPKSVCYSSSISLYSRIAHVIGIHNMGHYHYFAALFTELGLAMTASLAKFLNKKQNRKVSKKVYKRRLDVKVARSKKQKKQLQEIYKERTDTSYGHAVALTAINTKKQKSNADEQNAMKKKCKCGSETHRRITH
jgi:hypothetical protein